MIRSRRVRARCAAAVATTLCLVPALARPAFAEVRTVHGEAAGFRYQALLPGGYDDGSRRYPVVYVIAGNGSDERWAATALGLADYAARDEAIIVTPVEPEENNLITDWADGSKRLDHDFVERLVPAIDERFRTRAERSQRAITGVSAGGYSAMAIAARHPDLFVGAGAFSGVVDINDRGAAGQATVELPQVLLVDMKPDTLFRRFGDPYSHPLSWRERNPKDLARNFHATNLYAGAGDGTPASAEEAAAAGPALPPQMVIENQIRSMNDSFVGELAALGIQILYRPHAGIHTRAHWRDDIRSAWPRLIRAMGAAAPDAFDYRSAAADFSIWGWTFRADPRRAPEFLDVTAASTRGVTLTGSGTQRVTTARLFRPRARVSLAGATVAEARAGLDGRITFEVDLGAPHAAEQYTPAAEGQTFETRRVDFRERPGPECKRPSKLSFELHRGPRTRVVRVEVFANGDRKLVRTGRDLRRVDLTGLPRDGRLHVRITATHSNGSRVVSTRTWNGCKKGKPRVRLVRRRGPRRS